MSKQPRITNHMVARMREMRAAGKTFVQIARAEGVTDKTASKYTKDVIARLPIKPRRITKAMAQRMREMRAEGRSYRAIAVAVGTTEATAHKYARGIRQMGQWSRRIDYPMAFRLRFQERLPLAAIAKRYGVTPAAVCMALKRHRSQEAA
jgi:hypothetical protein